MKNNSILHDMSNTVNRIYHVWLGKQGMKAATRSLFIENKGKKFIVKNSGSLLTIINEENGNETFLNGKINKGGEIELSGENKKEIENAIDKFNSSPRYKEMEIIEERLYKFYIDKNKNIYVIRTDDKMKNLYGINNKDGRTSRTQYKKLESDSITLENGVEIKNLSQIIQNDKTKEGLKGYLSDIKEEEIYAHMNLLVNNTVNALLSDIRQMNGTVEEMYCCFDSKSWRKEFLEQYYENIPSLKGINISDLDYKGQRDKTNKQYIYDILIKVGEVIKELNMRYYKLEDTGIDAEADDAIEVLQKILNEQGKDVVVVSNDQDFHQVMGEHSKIYDPRQKREGAGSGGYVVLNQHKYYKSIIASARQIVAEKNGNTEKNAGKIDKFIESDVAYQEEVELLLKEIENSLSPIYLLTKIMAGDSSDNISSIVPSATISDIDVNIQFGEITVLKMLANGFFNSETKNFDEIVENIINELSEKYNKKCQTDIKKHLRKEYKEEGLTTKEANEKIEIKTADIEDDFYIPTSANFKEAIYFLYTRNKTMISFEEMKPEVRQGIIDYHNSLEVKNNSNATIAEYLKDIMPGLSAKYSSMVPVNQDNGSYNKF